MELTTWTLETRDPAELTGRTDLPPGFRVDRTSAVTPEFARFLYGMVGGPWRWTDRLGWSRQQWLTDLAVPATTFLIAYAAGVPQGYLQLGASKIGAGTEIEIKYFGLVESAIGRGLGGALLTRGIQCAWQQGESAGLPPVSRVWVHTCSLDGPNALSTYRACGLRVVDEQVTDEDYPDRPLGAWASTGGPPPPG